MPERKAQGEDLSNVTGGSTFNDILHTFAGGDIGENLPQPKDHHADAENDLAAAEADFASITPGDVTRDEALYSKAVDELAVGDFHQADADIKALRAEGDASSQ